MKRFLLLSLTVFIVLQMGFSTAFASGTTIKDSEYANIPDDDVRSRLTELAGKRYEDALKITDIENITKIEEDRDFISALRNLTNTRFDIGTGTAYFLKSKNYNGMFNYLFNNGITFDGKIRFEDLTGLNHLKNIDYLGIFGEHNTKYSDLSPLTEIEGLKYLVIEGSEVEDLTPLEKMKDLRLLMIKQSNIKSLDGIENLDNLVEVVASFNEIEDISAITNLENLRSLDLKENKISEMPKDLNKLKNLEFLDLKGNELTGSLDFIKDLESLTYLDVKNNNITDISALKGNNQLNYINTSGSNAIKDDNWNIEAHDFQIYRNKHYNHPEDSGFENKYEFCVYEAGCFTKLPGKITNNFHEEDKGQFKAPEESPTVKLEISPDILEDIPEQLTADLLNFRNRVGEEKFDNFVNSLKKEAKEALSKEIDYATNVHELDKDERDYLREAEKLNEEGIKEALDKKEKEDTFKMSKTIFVFGGAFAAIVLLFFLIKKFGLEKLRSLKDGAIKQTTGGRDLGFDENDFTSDNDEDKETDEDDDFEDFFGDDFEDFK